MKGGCINMFDEIGQIIFNNEIVAKASDFNMGIEVEAIRIDSSGRLTKEEYPKALGNQRKNHFIKTDVYQIQSEVITPAARKSLDAMHYLMALNDTLRNALEPNELLWPLSMPPILPRDKKQFRLRTLILINGHIMNVGLILEAIHRASQLVFI